MSVEIKARFRTKVDFRLFNSDWIRPTGYSFTNDYQLVLTNNGLNVEYYAYTPMLEKGKKYLIKYELVNFTELSSSWVRVRCGTTNGTKRTTEGKYEEYLTATTNNYLGINWYSTTTATIRNLSIEEVGFTRLDCGDDTTVEMNLGVNDIREISDKKSNYSNEIILPGTDTNNRFFKWVFDINSQNIFNINTKVDSVIVVDDVEWKNGYIKLERIIKNDSVVSYEVIFYGESSNLFADIKDKYLNELDYSDINHYATIDAITQSWGNPTMSYKYPYICYGDEPMKGVVGSALDKQKTLDSLGSVAPAGLGLVVADLYPGINLKYLIDKIFTTYGYTYTNQSFFNKDWFSRIYLPFVNDEEILNAYYLVAHYNFSGNIGLDYIVYGSNNFASLTTGKFTPDFEIYSLTDGIPSYGINNPTSIVEDIYSRFNISNNFFINQSTYFPTGNILSPQWMNNIIPGCYVTKKAGKHKLQMRIKINSTVSGYPVYVYATRIPRTGIETLPGSKYKVNSETCELVQTILSPTGGYVILEKEMYCEKDDNIAFKIISGFPITSSPTYFTGTVDWIKIYEYGYGKGVWVDFKNVVPQEMKMNDLFSNLINMFNLYIEETETNKQLSIQSYEDYYNAGDTKDFTYMLDLNSEQTIEFPQEYFSKNILFKYGDGDDTWNEYWSDNKDYKTTPIGYGGKLVRINNEFSDDETTIENTFAPTVLRSYWSKGETINNSSKITYSSIENFNYKENGVNRQRKTKTTPRILFYNKTDIFDNTTTKFRFESTDYTYYPYMGHILDPYGMTGSGELLDLNYDTLLYNDELSWSLMFIGFPIGYITKRNLYNVFWGNYINNFITKDSRILKAKFHLTKKEMLDLKLNDKIILNNTNYIINRVNNLDVECNNLVEMELLKIDNLSFTYSQAASSSILGGSIEPINPDNFILGENNILSPGTTGQIVIGNDNILGRDVESTNSGVLVVGNGNTGRDTNIIGDDNTGSTRGTMVGDDGRGVGATGSVVINGVTITGGEIVLSDSGLNDPGVDVVGVTFSNQGVDDSGLNKIWSLRDIDSDIVNDPGLN